MAASHHTEATHSTEAKAVIIVTEEVCKGISATKGLSEHLVCHLERESAATATAATTPTTELESSKVPEIWLGTATATLFEALLPVLVVDGALLWIGEHCIRFPHLLEVLFGDLLVAWVLVWVVLDG